MQTQTLLTSFRANRMDQSEFEAQTKLDIKNMSLFYLLLTSDDPFNALAKLCLNEMKILVN